MGVRNECVCRVGMSACGGSVCVCVSGCKGSLSV